jgi:hypothetical protein
LVTCTQQKRFAINCYVFGQKIIILTKKKKSFNFLNVNADKFSIKNEGIVFGMIPTKV